MISLSGLHRILLRNHVLVTAAATLLMTFGVAHAQSESALYSAAYGDPNDPAVIFLHGGPGYNCANFELSTATALAAKGWYVIVFDQRGCGRSQAVDAEYTFDEATADLEAIYRRYDLASAALIGHSWGGTLAIVFAERFPQKVSALMLTGAPLAYQWTFKTILKKCRERYTAQKSPQLQYITMLESMDTTSLAYSGYCFAHAMGCGLYTPSNPTEEAQKLYRRIQAADSAGYLTNLTQQPVQGFYKNEAYTTLNLNRRLANVAQTVNVSGVYGAEDGLFDSAHLARLEAIIGAERFKRVENAGHNVFIDRQAQFLAYAMELLKN